MKDNLEGRIENLSPEQKQKFEAAKKEIMKELGFQMLAPLKDKKGNLIQPEELIKPAYGDNLGGMSVAAVNPNKAFAMAGIYQQINNYKRKQKEITTLGGEYNGGNSQ